MRSGKHLTISERRVINFLLNSKFKQKKIAKAINIAESTLSYELKINTKPCGTYDPDYAQQKYNKRRVKCKKKSKLAVNSKLMNYVINGLQNYWSPEQISGLLKIKNSDENMYISPEGIYSHIYFGLLGHSFIPFLRQKRNKRRKRGLKKQKRIIIKDKKNIRERPEAANNKSRVGDWEGDTVVGKNNQGYIATFADRNSSYFAAALMPNKEAESLNRAASEAFKNIENENIKTITVDNGTEFAEFKNLETLFETQVYFADPYCSWQRGLNENTNGLLRQFFPKGINFKNISEEELEKVVCLINHRPRKKLGYFTPYEVFFKDKNIRLET